MNSRKLGVCIGIDKKCAISKQDGKDFFTKVKDVLNNDQGWKKYGFNFEVTCDAQKAYIKIWLTSPEHMRKLSSKSTAELNLCDMDKRIVYVHVDRWMDRNPQFNQSKMTLDDYRTYVLNHEIGHALGCTHLNACLVDGKSPVMKQQTPGQIDAEGKECTPNPYPTDADFNLTTGRSSIQGGGKKSACECHAHTLKLK